MDHRVALVVLVVLNAAAAGPLGLAWIRFLPEEPPPFAGPSSSSDDTANTPEIGSRLIAFFLLALVTFGCVIRFPGFPLNVPLHWLHSFFSDSDIGWIVFAVYTFFVVGLGLTACYAAVHPTRMRVPLVLAATFTLALWLLTPTIRMALLAG
jgi:hypothetical protein